MKYAVFQAVVIACIGAWALAFALRKYFPRAWRGLLAQVAAPLARAKPHAMQRIGAWLMPQQVAATRGCDSGGGCSSCGTCAPAPPPGDAQPLVFHRTVKR